MLPKHLRLRDRRDFKLVYKRGQTIAVPTLALYWRKTGGQGPRIGFSVSKKIGKAVERNRIKRRCRAVSRELLYHFTPGTDYIFVLRPAAAKADYQRLKADMAKSLALVTQRREKSGPSKPKAASDEGDKL
ncbi:MAG: ribonuclease P protein component [Clostridiales bacterium]|nr:ribonuclease P protein component [Clostridiales bacterium]